MGVRVHVLLRRVAHAARGREVRRDAFGKEPDVVRVLARVLRVVGDARVRRDVSGGAVGWPPSVTARSAIESLKLASETANVSNNGWSAAKWRPLMFQWATLI